jgi:hypothetical protein
VPVAAALTPRWTPLRPIPEQVRLWNSPARFNVAAAGRRSGKTERAKRKLVRCALAERVLPDARFVYAAPTREWAKRVAWRDLKALVPRWARLGRPNESELSIEIKNGATLQVIGLENPERAEGPPLDGIVLDEYANTKPGAWDEHILPALTTDGRPPGWAWFVGTPEGRNHFWRLHCEAATKPGWASFWWPSSVVLSAKAIEEARANTDELTFAQEYEASFVNFAGRAYHPFERTVHAREELPYSPDLPIALCFDFNVRPGVAAVLQEQAFRWPGHPRADRPEVDDRITGAIGELYIPSNSNTQAVCRRLVADWGKHRGEVHLYGDATGGASGSAKVSGSDWAIIQGELRPVFGDRLSTRVPKANPLERVRINSVNSRLRAANGIVRFLVDPKRAPWIANDMEAVVVLAGGTGEIDKRKDEMATHLSDAVGYYIVRAHPIAGHETTIEAA